MKKRNQRKTKRLLVIFFLISILIHILVVIVSFKHVFVKKTRNFVQAINSLLTPSERDAYEKKQIEKKKKIESQFTTLTALNTDNRPAQLRAPHSHFGWVLFDDTEPPRKETLNDPVQIPITHDGDVGQSMLNYATDEEPIVAEQESSTPPPPDNNTQKAYPTEKPFMVAPTPSPQATMLQDENEESKTEQNKEITSADTLSSESPTQKMVAEHNNQTNNDANQALKKRVDIPVAMTPPAVSQTLSIAALSLVQAGTQRSTARVRGAQSITQKPKRNIIALTKGFVEKYHGPEGTDLIDRDGDPDKQPSFEELKYLSYEAKLNWSLQASWKQNFSRRPAKDVTDSEAVVKFTIDSKGNLIDSALLQSTGHKELDTMVLKNLTFASPYPPIPKHFGTTTYTTTRAIKIYSNKFSS